MLSKQIFPATKSLVLPKNGKYISRIVYPIFYIFS